MVDLAPLLGLARLQDNSCIRIPTISISRENVADWPFSANILLESQRGASDLVKIWISYLDLLIMFEHSLLSEWITRPLLQAHRPFVSSSTLARGVVSWTIIKNPGTR